METVFSYFGIKFNGVHPEINTRKMLNAIVDVALPIICGLYLASSAKNYLQGIETIKGIQISQKMARVIIAVASAVGALFGYAILKFVKTSSVPHNIQANLDRLHLTRISKNIFSTSSGFQFNMRTFIRDMYPGQHLLQSRQNINLSGIAHNGWSREVICKTPQDLEDLIAIGRELFPLETVDLENTVEQVRNYKEELSNKFFPSEIIDIFSMLSTIMHQRNFQAFGDRDRYHAEVRQDAMWYAKDALEKYTMINGKPKDAMKFLANYHGQLSYRTISDCLQQSLTNNLCINDTAPSNFADMFPIGIHLIRSDEDACPKAETEKARMFEILSGNFNQGKHKRHPNAE